MHFRVWDDEEWNVAEPDPADFFNVLENPMTGTLMNILIFSVDTLSRYLR